MSLEDRYEDFVQDIEEKFKYIHASTLYNYDIGSKILQEICMLFNRTNPDTVWNNWQHFAEELGFKSRHIDRLGNYSYKNQTPIETLLRIYKNKEDATISKIITTLNKIGRFDILMSVKKLLYEFLKLEPKRKNLDQKQEDIPFEFRTIQTYHFKRINEKQKQKYEKFIFLTFATENINLAWRVAEYLGQDFNGKKIGVLVLHELVKFQKLEPTAIINKFFSHSKFVIPIITPEYLNLIYSDDKFNKYDCDSVDSKYAKYIFKMMDSLLLHNYNNTYKIRPVLFEDDADEILQNRKFKNTLAFQHWYYFENLNSLAKAILHH